MPLTWQVFSDSVRTLRRFHLLLQTEWLPHNATRVVTERVLGWTVPPRKVLPHESQARRGGVSASAREALSEDTYAFLLADNSLDLLMYHVSLRLSLERMCGAGAID